MAKVKVCGSCGELLVFCECSIGGMWECHNFFCDCFYERLTSVTRVVEREAEEGEENDSYTTWD